jgi:hypothetical protein
MHRASSIKVRAHSISRRLPDRDHSFTSPLPEEAHRALSEINPIEIEIYDLADAATRSVEQLPECTRALCISYGEFAAIAWNGERHKESFHFVWSQHGGEVASCARQVNLATQRPRHLTLSLCKSVEDAERCGAATLGGDGNVRIGQPLLRRLRITAPGLSRTKRCGKRTVVATVGLKCAR